MRHCRRLKHRAREHARCSHNQILLLKSKIRACHHHACRRRYTRRLARCVNVVVLPTRATRPHRTSKPIVLVKGPGAKVHHTHLTCIDNLKTHRYQKQVRRFKRKLAKCLKPKCKRKYRGKLQRLNRRRMRLLRKRLGRCGVRRHKKYLEKRLRALHRMDRRFENIKKRHRIAELRKKIVKCKNNAACVHRLDEKIRRLAMSMDEVENMYYNLKAKLALCPAGLSGHVCKKRVMDKYRRDLYAKQVAMLRHQLEYARKNFAQDVAGCSRNLLGNPRQIASCVDNAKHAFARRENVLRGRRLRVDLRRAMHDCEATADPKQCVRAAKAEFKKDMAIAKSDADLAAKLVLEQVTHATAKPKI
jgi:hypothetical protein